MVAQSNIVALDIEKSELALALYVITMIWWKLEVEKRASPWEKQFWTQKI